MQATTIPSSAELSLQECLERIRQGMSLKIVANSPIQFFALVTVVFVALPFAVVAIDLSAKYGLVDRAVLSTIALGVITVIVIYSLLTFSSNRELIISKDRLETRSIWGSRTIEWSTVRQWSCFDDGNARSRGGRDLIRANMVHGGFWRSPGFSGRDPNSLELLYVVFETRVGPPISIFDSIPTWRWRLSPSACDLRVQVVPLTASNRIVFNVSRWHRNKRPPA